MNARKLVPAVTLCMLVCGLIFSIAPAFAAKQYAPGATFAGEPGGGAGQLEDPEGVAINDLSGDVYVADRGNNRVDEFENNGTFVRAWGWGVVNGGLGGVETCTPASLGGCQVGAVGSGPGQFDGPQWIAVDNSGGGPSNEDVYVTDVGNDVIEKFNALGAYEGQLTGTCAAPGTCPGKAIPFGELLGVAVSRSGNLWVYGGSGVDEFSSSGSFVGAFNTGRGAQPGLAVDSNENVYIVNGEPKVSMFEAGHVEPGSELAEFGSGVSGLAIDPATDDVFVDEASSIARYGPVDEPHPAPLQILPGAELSNSRGVAVNDAGTVYASQAGTDDLEAFRLVEPPETEAASEVTEISATEDSATLHGTVRPEGEPLTECKFDYGTTESYGQEAPCKDMPTGIEPQPVSAKIGGLEPRTVYHFRLVVADQKNGAINGNDEIFFTAHVPVVENESVLSTGSTEASVTASIDASGSPTTYHVEYGIGEAYGSSTPEVSLGAAQASVGVLVKLGGLQAGIVYHYRLVATNTFGMIAGPDATFTTAAVTQSATGLPNHRAYELVAPHDATEVYGPPLHQYTPGEPEGGVADEYTRVYKDYQAAANGEAVAFVGGAPASASGGSGFVGTSTGNQYLARRGPDAWEDADIEPPGYELAISTFSAFSEDLTAYVLKTQFPLTATPDAPSQCADDGSAAPYLNDAGGYHSLITAAADGSCEAKGVEISADGDHVLLYSPSAYTEGAVPAKENNPEDNPEENLYDAVAGRLYQVNILPDGAPEEHPNALFGGRQHHEESIYEATFEHAASRDGSRIFWTALEGSGEEKQPRALYARLNDTQPQSPSMGEVCTEAADACTVQLDRAQTGAGGASGAGRFWDASADGTHVFFTDCHRLTVGSTADAENGCAPKKVKGGVDPGTELTGNDLYEYDFDKPEGERLTDLTVDNKDAGGANVQGVIGVSESGDSVYFVAEGALTAGPNVEGHEPVAGQPNLYSSMGGVTTFIATLTTGDDHFTNLSTTFQAAATSGDWEMEPGRRTAEVTPSGGAVSFMSTQSLTGYDNYGVAGDSNAGTLTDADLPEVFVYQAATQRITCVSCAPSGQPPVRGSELWEDARNANVGLSGQPANQSRWITEAEGLQIYFMTDQPLIPGDANHRQDVYEWEADGSGECSQVTGCVAPLSSVIAPAPATFLDASANGQDVFFTQRAALVPQAIDETLKLYDARVDGGFPESSEACTGTGCQGVPPAPPTFATPSSVTFNGPGDFPPLTPVKKTTVKKAVKCKTRFVKNKKGKCVKRPKKKPKKTKKTSHDGRGK
jgi:hypothetical protein